jgi:hypothetical protein
MAIGGDAARGANEKLMSYVTGGTMTSRDLSKFAVFGADDTPPNREYVLNSATNKSILRGFMGLTDIAVEIKSMVEMGIKKQDGVFSAQTCIGRLSTDKTSVEVTYFEKQIWPDPEMFFVNN